MSRSRFRSWCAIGAVCGLATACIQTEPGNAADSAKSDAAMQAERAAAYSANGSLTITENGYGPLAIGMTVADAAQSIGAPLPSAPGASAPGASAPGASAPRPTAPVSNQPCTYVTLANTPPGMRIMAVRDTVVRIEVDSGPVATGLGARIGDPEWRVRDLYGSRVTVQPSKYVTGGHYLVVSPIPPTDSGHRMLFETDGSRVTSYRVGRVPEVQWVEGCS